MKTSKLIFHSFKNSLAVFVYTSAIAWLLSHGEKFFGGKEDNFLMPATMLLLLVLSVAIVGILVFGQPVYLYLNNSKPLAIKLLFYTLAWLTIFIFLIFMAQIIF